MRGRGEEGKKGNKEEGKRWEKEERETGRKKVMLRSGERKRENISKKRKKEKRENKIEENKRLEKSEQKGGKKERKSVVFTYFLHLINFPQRDGFIKAFFTYLKVYIEPDPYACGWSG